MSAEATDPTEVHDDVQDQLDTDAGGDDGEADLPDAPESRPDAPVARPMPPGFDLMQKEPLSFAALEAGRRSVFATSDRRDSFRRTLDGLGPAGEDGRRRGLGLWILGRFEECARALEPFGSDATAAYTRAQALMSLRRYDEARGVFQELTGRYPDEPRPRAGWLEARLELEVEDADDASAEEIDREVLAAPGDFAESAEGRYLRGRLAEKRRDWETALDHYVEGRRVDPGHRALLHHLGHLAQRCGLDDLAIEAYEELLDLHAADRTVLLNLGVLYEDAGRDSDAASCYDVVLRNDPTDSRARLYLQDARAAIDMYYDEDMEKKEDRLNQILRIPITDFELSVRARNCLNKMQITTLGDLVQRTEQELLSYKNFGETSLTEIKEILHSKGLRLGMPRDEAVASIEAHASRLQTGDKSDVVNKPILELSLSIRARRTVETLGCLTVGDITKHSAEELLGMPNFGQTSLQELRSKLAELGLKLKGD